MIFFLFFESLKFLKKFLPRNDYRLILKWNYFHLRHKMEQIWWHFWVLKKFHKLFFSLSCFRTKYRGKWTWKKLIYILNDVIDGSKSKTHKLFGCIFLHFYDFHTQNEQKIILLNSVKFLFSSKIFLLIAAHTRLKNLTILEKSSFFFDFWSYFLKFCPTKKFTNTKILHKNHSNLRISVKKN